MALKTTLHKQYQTDHDKEESGVWVDFENGVAFRIRRFSSEISMKARREAEKPHTARLRNGKISDEVAEQIAIEQLANGIIADWKGLYEPVLDENGKPKIGEDGKPLEKEIKFSKKAALEILNDPELEEFRAELIRISIERDNFKADEDEDSLGNS